MKSARALAERTSGASDLDGRHHTVGFPIQNTNQGRKYGNLSRQQKPKALTSPL